MNVPKLDPRRPADPAAPGIYAQIVRTAAALRRAQAPRLEKLGAMARVRNLAQVQARAWLAIDNAQRAARLEAGRPTADDLEDQPAAPPPAPLGLRR